MEIKYNVIRGEVGELPNGDRKRAQLVGAEIEPERERERESDETSRDD